MMTRAASIPRNPPAMSPKSQQKKSPEITAPTPNAHKSSTRACRRRARFSMYLASGLVYETFSTALVCITEAVKLGNAQYAPAPTVSDSFWLFVPAIRPESRRCAEVSGKALSEESKAQRDPHGRHRKGIAHSGQRTCGRCGMWVR